jgi:peptidoglycan/LPS O-acetylase OafA/YrhL
MRDNNFDTMRLAAALAVVLSHSFPISYGSGAPDPLNAITDYQISLGALAVAVFFIISGYLITGSFDRQNPKRFVVSRALRLLPGLAAVLLVLTFIAGPILTATSLSEYFHSSDTYRFLLINFTLTDFSGVLPGVFDGNPFPHAVNGSLWTLRYEAECYLLVLVFGLVGILNRYVLLALLAAILGKVGYGGDDYRLSFYAYFLAGAVFYSWQFPLRWYYALGAAVLCLLTLWCGAIRWAIPTAFAYLVLYIGLASTIRMPRVTRWGDLSYGVYVWAFPIQQSVTLVLGTWATWYFNVTIAVPIILGIAYLSWRFVEGPALSLKPRSYPAPEHPAIGDLQYAATMPSLSL